MTFPLRKSTLLVIALLPSFASLFAEPSPRYQAQDGWRMLQGALSFALKGNREAIHDCFMASYLRASSPFFGGEDCEAIHEGLSEILFGVGDRNFSQALRVERPEIIAAVEFWIGQSLGFQDIGKGDGRSGKGWIPLRMEDYPRTKKLLDSAPKTDFPEREGSARRGPLLKELSAHPYAPVEPPPRWATHPRDPK